MTETPGPLSPTDGSEDFDFTPVALARIARQREAAWYRANYPFATCLTVTTGNIDANDVIAALNVTEGDMGTAAKILGVSRASLRKFIDKTPVVGQMLFDLRESILDSVEMLALKQALDGDGAQIRFVLQTIGKDRGFSTKSETETTLKGDSTLSGLLDRIANGGKPLVERVEFEDITDEVQTEAETIEAEAEISDDPAESGPVSRSEVEDIEPLQDH